MMYFLVSVCFYLCFLMVLADNLGHEKAFLSSLTLKPVISMRFLALSLSFVHAYGWLNPSALSEYSWNASFGLNVSSPPSFVTSKSWALHDAGPNPTSSRLPDTQYCFLDNVIDLPSTI